MSDQLAAPMSGPSPSQQHRRGDDQVARWLCWLALIVFIAVLLRTAWLADDAYISFRTIRNFVAGDGLRWNIAERVQAFTHPLWVLVLSAFYSLTGDLYYTTLFVSVALSIATTAWVGWRIAPTRMMGLTSLVALFCSRSFVDYSTSGLEDPLTHLLLALLCGQYLGGRRDQRSLFTIAFLAGLCATTRLDTVVLTTPVVAFLFASHFRNRQGALIVAAGYAPIFVWEIFSLLYYGFPFPNTAYAKLPAAISLWSRFGKGGGYLLSTLFYDPVGITLLLAGIALPFVRHRRRLQPLAAGCALYVGYTVWVGGDFMAGRFLSAPILVAVIVLAHSVSLPAPRRLAFAPAAGLLLLSLTVGPRATLISGADFATQWHWRKNIDRRRVADERAIYFKITGLLRQEHAFERPVHAWFDMGKRVRPGQVTVATTLGFFGWAAPRDAYIIDPLALSDPFLARQPPKNVQNWRPGHLDREVTDDYRKTRISGVNHLRDPRLAELYDRLQLITAGPLWRLERFKAIASMNLPGF